MRVLITGAGGQLGWELERRRPADHHVLGLVRADLDICDTERVPQVVSELRPDLIINSASYTAVDRAEEESTKAYAINAAGAAHIAQAAMTTDARLIHISTDFVFDGGAYRPYAPGAQGNPLSVYGASKLEGERRIVAICKGSATIVRTAWVYSAHGHNFVKTMLRLMRERDRLHIVADQIGTPTWARGLADAIWKIAAEPQMCGIYHWTDAGVASWYDFAVAIQEEGVACGLLSGSIPISPICTDQYPTPARRPPYSVLDKSTTWNALGAVAPHWRASLRQMLKGLKDGA